MIRPRLHARVSESKLESQNPTYDPYALFLFLCALFLYALFLSGMGLARNILCARVTDVLEWQKAT
jgi:hypothetical protein